MLCHGTESSVFSVWVDGSCATVQDQAWSVCLNKETTLKAKPFYLKWKSCYEVLFIRIHVLLFILACEHTAVFDVDFWWNSIPSVPGLGTAVIWIWSMITDMLISEFLSAGHSSIFTLASCAPQSAAGSDTLLQNMAAWLQSLLQGVRRVLKSIKSS